MTSHTVGGITTSYGYDLADQLISESRPGYAASYTYDANGNRATRTVNGQTETHVSDAADKLMSISVGGNTVRSFTYDGRGRRKTDTSSGNTTVYSWDAESRLVGMTKPGLKTSYGYNGLDARTSRTVGANTTTYKRAGAYVTDPVLNETTGQFSANYTPGVSERRAGVSTYLHSGLKNADARTTDGSSVTAHREYDAFGNLTGGNGTWNGPFGYAGGFGYQEDGESGLKLLGHRYYDSTTGRFISKDPIGDGRNWYSYCGNNPITGKDPTGLWDWGKYWSDVGSVFRGYGRALDPRNMWAGLVALADILKTQGVSAAGLALFEGLKQTLAGLFQGDDPEKFGESLMTVLISVASAAGGGAAAAKLAKGSRAARIAAALKVIENYLGPGYTLRKNKAGDLVLMSADGKRKVRIDYNRPYPHQNPHVDIEELTSDGWVNVGKVYPKDVIPH